MYTMRATLFFILLSMTIGYSQNLPSDMPTDQGSDVMALDILDAVHKDYHSVDSHRFDFSIGMEYPEHEGENFNGTLIQKGEQFSLDVKDRKIISDNTTVWVYHKKRNEVEINDAEPGDTGDIMTPSKIIDLYKSDDYIFVISNYIFEKGEDVTQIECKPTDRASEYSKIRLTIADKSKAIRRVKVFYKDGTRMTMILDKHQKGYSTDAATFGFDESQHEGVHVEDLRF